MGLSANQAKLLTITARLSDNELRAQFITNAKVRLAESSNEATTEYMRALDSSDLMYSFYDADNQKNSMKLTAGALMTYGENKNQYGLINTAGQIMVSTTDKANFENSTTLVSFLQKYDALFSDRPLYIGDMAELYGENWPRYEDLGNIYKNYNTISGATDSKLNSIGAYSTDAEGKKDWEAKSPDGRDTYDEAVETYKNKMFTSSNGTAQDGGLVGKLNAQLEAAKVAHLAPYTNQDGTLKGAELAAAKSAGLDPLAAYNQAVRDAYSSFNQQAYGVNSPTVSQPYTPVAGSAYGDYVLAQRTFMSKLGIYDDSFETFNTGMTTWYDAQDRSTATGMQGLTGNWMDQLGDIPEGELVDLEAFFNNNVGVMGMVDLSNFGELRELSELPTYNPPPEFDPDAFAASFNDWPEDIVPSTGNCWQSATTWMNGFNHFTHHFQPFLTWFASMGIGTNNTSGLQDQRVTTTDAQQVKIKDDMIALMADTYYSTVNPMTGVSNQSLFEAIATFNESTLQALGTLGVSSGGSAASSTTKNAVKAALDAIKPVLDRLMTGANASGVYDNLVSNLNSATTNSNVANVVANGFYDMLNSIMRQVGFNNALNAASAQAQADADAAKAAYEAAFAAELASILADNNAIVAENNVILNGNQDNVNNYQDDYANFESRHASFDAKVDERIDTYSEYLNLTEELRYNVYTQLSTNFAEIPNERDPKTEWYTNLWYRMGGTSETTKADPNHAYKHIEDKYLDNEAWLQWAIETGTIAMEQVIFNEKGSEEYLNLKQREWKSISYSNSSDIKSEQDQRAITRAEVKYEKTLREIQSKDKQYDNDLKRLDTQHTALQQEYESLKAITDKNIERSFKAFS